MRSRGVKLTGDQFHKINCGSGGSLDGGALVKFDCFLKRAPRKPRRTIKARLTYPRTR